MKLRDFDLKPPVYLKLIAPSHSDGPEVEGLERGA